MARTRLIKPGTFKNEVLAKCDPFARILFTGLWCLADRDGKLQDRPERIKAEVLPYDTVDITVLLQQLSDNKFITRYEVGDEKIILINNFKVHQHPHKTEALSIIPDIGDTYVKQPLSNGSSRALTLNPSPNTLTLNHSEDFKENILEKKDRNAIRLKTSTIDTAKEILPRADIYAVESEWRGKEAEYPKNPDNAFLGYCRGYAKHHPELALREKWDS